MKERTLTLRKYATLACSILVVGPLNMVDLLGCMLPYITSYLRYRDNRTTYEDTAIMALSVFCFSGLFSPPCGFISRRLPTKVAIFLGCAMFSGGILLTYLSIQYSLALCVLAFSVFGCIGKDAVVPNVYKMVLPWFPGHEGFVNGIIASSYGLSVFLEDVLFTRYINPDNAIPDATVMDNYYFSQTSLLNRVPSLFLAFGLGLVAVQFTGVSLMSHAPDRNSDYHQQTITTDERRDVPPTKMIKDKLFISYYVAMAFYNLTNLMFRTFVKTYAQTFIRNDHFLGFVLGASGVSVALGGIVWGKVADYFGVLETFTMTQLVGASALLCFLFAEYFGKYFFLCCALIIYVSFSGPVVIAGTLVMSYFGTEHFTANYGILDSHKFVSFILSQLIMRVLSGFNVIYIFYAVTVSSTVAFIASVVYRPTQESFRC